MAQTAILLTTFNRPKLVTDAIESVLGQDTDNYRLYIMDDGCNADARRAIADIMRHQNGVFIIPESADLSSGEWRSADYHRIVWHQGPKRSPEERRAVIPYSMTINLALNFLLSDEEYVAYLCDDDNYYPESVRVRAAFLDENPDAHVVYGRSRSVQFDRGGFNKWEGARDPVPGRHYPKPTGERVLQAGGCSARHYFLDGEMDPETGLPFVEEAFFVEGPSSYGSPGKIDHNSFMHRRSCLDYCFPWQDHPSGHGKEFWGEATSWGVGDAAFLTMLGAPHPFFGLNEWVVSKKYHALSDGVTNGERRE